MPIVTKSAMSYLFIGCLFYNDNGYAFNRIQRMGTHVIKRGLLTKTIGALHLDQIWITVLLQVVPVYVAALSPYLGAKRACISAWVNFSLHLLITILYGHQNRSSLELSSPEIESHLAHQYMTQGECTWPWTASALVPPSDKYLQPQGAVCRRNLGGGVLILLASGHSIFLTYHDLASISYM